MRVRLAAALASVLALTAAAAQAQIYRWTDEQGRTHFTDTPPPASAGSVEKRSGDAPGVSMQTPYELSRAIKDYPVTLYTSPNCVDPCASARGVLNRRGVPFTEVQVWEDASVAELKRISGGNDVPTLVVGRSVHRGFEASAYDSLLDAARYPKAGVVRPRAQAAPPPPEGYKPPEKK